MPQFNPDPYLIILFSLLIINALQLHSEPMDNNNDENVQLGGISLFAQPRSLAEIG